MSTVKTYKLLSASSEATEAIGRTLGQNLKGGESIELISDLGGGKTTLVRGIAKGFGSPDKVASPTFTLNKEYLSGDKRIVHYDFYRLHDAGLMEFELAETLADPAAVAIVEWADIVHDVLPKQRATINISNTGDNSRAMVVTVPESLSYLVKDLETTE